VSGYRLPAPQGCWIDRSRAMGFSFNGQPLSGLAGDTLASALLASGVQHTGRSFKLHRPRGIVSAGMEEPTGLLDVGEGATRTPNTRASDIELYDGLIARTGNAWPSLRWDLGALAGRFSELLPAGFYYKTFMWPHWHSFEPAIRRAAGLGHAADAADPERYDDVSRVVDTLVVGGGPAGLAAARAAAEAGREVLLMHASAQAAGAAPGIDLVTRCTVFGLYDHGLVAAVQTLGGHVRERLWRVRARRIILACGALERPMLFPDNDRPGIMLAGAVQRYAERFGVACGRTVVITAACDSAYAMAARLLQAGVNVAALVDHRDQAGVPVPEGLTVLRASAIVAVQGARGVQGVSLASHDGRTRLELEADCLASAGGWTPFVNLYSMAGGALRWNDGAAMFVPSRQLAGIELVGACAGAFDTEAALDHARRVGAGASGLPTVGGVGLVPRLNLPRAPFKGKVFVDLQNDVVADDVTLAAREHYRSVEHLKRYTTMGMATDQGKTSNVNALVLMGQATGRTPAEVGTTKFRPPVKPVTLNALAAGRVGARLAPLRRLPAQDWHVARGGLFEEFGGWLRPAAYPRTGESLLAAAEREAWQVRQTVGLFEGSPLGKIEVYGPDAARFLDLMYVGTMSSLPVGAARYGLLLGENGVVVDDGIVARLGEQHFWVNTTSGGVARAVEAFEEWLQCEHVHLQVLITPVTSAWGNVTVSGPKAWALLNAAGFDAALAPGQMKHMSMREVCRGGRPLRVLRASFNGELGYEINLPATQTQGLLERLWAVGQDLGVVAYGIEALMIMRTEKGFLHIGADTDGTTLPGDVGMDRGIAKKSANFVGRRSLLRPAALDAGRLQLVGLIPLDGRSRLPVGAHITPRRPPAPIDGFVTSSCHSPSLGHPIALAMLKSGRQRLGEEITAYHLGAPVRARVVATPFFDPQGERLNG